MDEKSYLDSYRVSLNDTVNVLENYLTVKKETNKRINLIKNAIINQLIYEVKDIPNEITKETISEYKFKRVKELESMIV